MKNSKAYLIGQLIAKITIAIMFIAGLLLAMYFDQVAINMGMLH